MIGQGKKWTPEEDDYKKWTAEEINYLMDKWGIVSLPGMASKLGRSVNAIRLKARKMGLGNSIHAGEMITFSDLVTTIGKGNSYSWLREKWGKYDFPFRRKKAVTRSVLMVDIDDFWKWAEKHQDILDFADFEQYALGREPDWAKEKRRMDYRNRKRNAQKWTKQDDDRLLHMLQAQKYSLDEIAEALQRREGAVRRRIDILNTKYRPVRNTRKRWTKEEIETLTTMHAAGHSYEEISAATGRSALACRGRYERILSEEGDE